MRCQISQDRMEPAVSHRRQLQLNYDPAMKKCHLNFKELLNHIYFENSVITPFLMDPNISVIMRVQCISTLNHGYFRKLYHNVDFEISLNEVDIKF